jgi:polar amino acid transport system substrate-binding protein
MTKRFTTPIAAITLAAVASLASACGSSDSTAGSASGDASGAAPEKVTVGMSWPYAPWQVGDGTTQKGGAEPDILAAIGKAENIDFELENVDFTGIVTGTQSGKYDLAVSGLGVYGDRLKALDFVPDASTGYTILENKADAQKYTTIGDLCGVKASVGNGTRNASDVEVANGTAEPSDSIQKAYAGVCKSNPIKADDFNDQGSQDLAFQTGKDAVELLTQQVAENYAEKSDGKFVAAQPYAHVFFGMGVAKDNTALADKLIAGMKAIIANGSYAAILKKYKLGSDSGVKASDVKLLTASTVS